MELLPRKQICGTTSVLAASVAWQFYNTTVKTLYGKMAIILAFYQQAGGVMKTTLSQNLAYQLTLLGYRVLLIDLDPQSTLTIFMGLIPRQLDQTLYHAIIEEAPLPIVQDIHSIDFSPGSIHLNMAESQLAAADLREQRLKDAIDGVKDNYDFILVDCPPSLGLISYMGLVAATHVVVPVECHFKCLEGTSELLKTVTRVRSKVNRNLKIAGFIPTKYDARNTQDIRMLAAIKEQLTPTASVFAPIPRSTTFVDASEERKPLAVYAPKHPAVKVLEQFTTSLLESLK